MTAWTLLAVLLTSALVVPATIAVPTPPTPNPVNDPTPNLPNAIDEVHWVEFSGDMTRIFLNSTFVIHEVEFRELGPRTADDLRGPAGPALRPLLEQNLVAAVRQALEVTFPNATIRVALAERAYGVSDGDLDPYHPGVVLTTRATVGLGHEYFFGRPIDGLDLSELIRGVFAAGGSFHAELALAAPPGHRVGYDISVPHWLAIEGAGANGHLTGILDNYQGDNLAGRIVLDIADPLAAVNLEAYQSEGVQVAVLVDIDEPKISLLSGGAGTVEVNVDVDIEMHHMAMPEGLRAVLPSTIRMEHVNSDFIRLAAANHLLDRDAFAEALGGLVAYNVQYVMGAESQVTFDETLFLSTLDAPYRADRLDSGEPLVIRAQGHTLRNLTIEATQEASALKRIGSISLGVVSPVKRTVLPAQEYFLKSFYDWNTTYTFLYPRGMDLWVNDTAGRAQPISEGSRDGFTVSVTGGEVHYLQATPSFGAAFLLTILPVLPIMGALLALSAVSTGGVIYAKRARRRKVRP